MGDPGREFINGGLAVEGVLPDSIASAASLRRGDVVHAIGGASAGDMRGLRAAIASIRDHDETMLVYGRGGRRHEVKVSVCRWPRETLDGHRVVYDSIEVGGPRVRSILTLPASDGPHPAIVFAQGIRRGTVDLPMSPQAPLRRWVEELAARGLATMRLERRGVGDSEGGPFDALDFTTEVGDVIAGIRALAARDDIDASRVALFGHSSGGMLAPLAAGEGGARAVIVYGTAVASWFDCVRASARHQLDVDGDRGNTSSLETLERDIAAIAAGKDPQLFGRCAAFHQQLDATDLAAAWARVKAPVLVLHGEHDWVVDRDDARELVSLRQRRGLDVDALELAGLDHAMTTQPTRAQSIERYGAGRFGDGLASHTATWLTRTWQRFAAPS